MGMRDRLKAFRQFAYTADEHYKLIPLLLLAFLLRLNGLAFGLPYIFHPDEHQYVDAGIAFLQGQENAVAELQKLNNPPLFKSALGLLYVLYARILILQPGQIQTTIDSQVWRMFFQYVGRFASISTGLLTVVLLYALGKRLYSRTTAILGAFLLAVTFLHVRESHFAVNDVPLTFLVVASLYLGAGVLCRGRWFDYLAAGFLIGLTAATKYTGVQLTSILIGAHLLRQREGDFKPLNWLMSSRLLSGLAMILVGFAVGAPIALVHWRETIRRIGRLAEYGRFGYHDLLIDPQGGWIFYLKTLAWGAGFLMFAALVVALLVSLIYRSRADVYLIISPLLLYLTMGNQKMFFARLILPALPPLILLVAAWTERLSWSKLIPTKNIEVILFVAAALLAFQPLASSIWFGVLLNRLDTRELATDWIRSNIPEGSVIYADTYAIVRNSVTGHVSLPYVQPRRLSFGYPDLLEYYRERGVQFVITTDYYNERRYTDQKKEMERKDWVTTISQLDLIQEFWPYWRPRGGFSIDQHYGPAHETLMRQHPGPVVRVYALDPKPNWYGLNPFIESNQISGKASVFGYEMSPETLPGDTLDVAVYWLDEGWRSSDDLHVTLVDLGGFEIGRAVASPVLGFEEPEQGGGIVKSQARLSIPEGTPPGTYKLRLEVYDHDKFQALESLPIEQARVTVARSTSLVDLASEPLSPGASVAPGVSLATHELSVPDIIMQDTLALGQDNWMLLLWRTDRNVSQDYTIRLILTDVQGNVAAVWEGQPVHGNYPTSNWTAGELVRDPWNLKLPETIAPGSNYRLSLTLLNHDGKIVGEKELGAMLVSDRTRSSTIPIMQHTVDAIWGGTFRLLGFDLRAVPDSANSGWLELDLYWQSVASIETDYLISIRLVDSHSQIILSQEGPPAGGRAPTSLWQPGEVVQDFHALKYHDLAMSENHRLEIAIVDSQTGELLPVAEGGGIANTLMLASWP